MPAHSLHTRRSSKVAYLGRHKQRPCCHVSFVRSEPHTEIHHRPSLGETAPEAADHADVSPFLPFWTSILVKCFALTIILGRHGIINNFISWASGVDVQLPLVLIRFLQSSGARLAESLGN